MSMTHVRKATPAEHSTAKLLQAARLIEEVAAELDRSGNVCDCCGLTVQANRPEFLRGVELDAMVKKLERFGGVGH
jgi:hypothetical protein